MRLRRTLHRLHRLLGLALGAVIALMSLTGGVLVMHHEVEHAVSPERHHVASPGPAATRAPLLPILRQLATEAPAGARVLRVEPGLTPTATDKILFVARDQRTRWSAFVNPYTGAILWRGEDQALLTPWLLQLHMQLRIGSHGYLVTALAGISLLLLGLTGLCIHRAGFADLFRRPLRLGRGWRAACADLHRWVGLASIYFCLILGLTGAIYAITSWTKLSAAPKTATTPFDLARLTPLEPVIASARSHFPDAELFRIAFPANAKAPLTLTLLHRDAPVWRKFSRVEFDPVTGAVRSVRDARLASASEKFSAMLAPLHFGFYGSPLVKWLYVVGGFSPALLAASGLALALLRRRQTTTVLPALETASAPVS